MVEIDDLPEKVGSIIIPETAERRDRIGVVRCAGNSKELKVGDRVIYNTYSEKLEVDGKRYRVVKESNCLAVIENGADVSVNTPSLESKIRMSPLEDLD